MGAGKSKGEVVAREANAERRHSVTSLTEIEAGPKDPEAGGMRRARSSLSLPRRFSLSAKRSIIRQRAHTMPKSPDTGGSDDILKARKRISREAKTLKAWVDDRTCKCREVPCLAELASLTITGQLRGVQDINQLPIFHELKSALEFRFCPTFDGSLTPEKVQFSNNDRTVVYTGRGYSTTCVKTPFDKGLRNGRHAWMMHVDSSRVVGWMHIGVVNEDRKETGCRTLWDGNPHPFRDGEVSRSSNGNYNSGAREHQVQSMQFAGGFTTGDTISVKLDLDVGTIQWLRNGEDYGEPAQLQDDVYFPSVSLDSPGEGVTMVFYVGSPGI